MLGGTDEQAQYLGAEVGSSGSSNLEVRLIFVGCPASASSQICKLPPSSLRDPTCDQSSLATISAKHYSLNYLSVQPGLCSSPQGQSLWFSGTTSTCKDGKTGAASPSRQLCTETAALYSATKR